TPSPNKPGPEIPGPGTSEPEIPPMEPPQPEPGSPTFGLRDGNGTRRASARGNTPTISPRAMRVAEELGVEWRQLQGSGRNCRIRERDVQAVAAGRSTTLAQGHRAASADSTETAARGALRRTIAARMAAGAQTTAPVTLTTTADATNLVSLRAQFKAAATG